MPISGCRDIGERDVAPPRRTRRHHIVSAGTLANVGGIGDHMIEGHLRGMTLQGLDVLRRSESTGLALLFHKIQVKMNETILYVDQNLLNTLMQAILNRLFFLKQKCVSNHCQTTLLQYH